MLERVLVAVDGSERSDRAVRMAAAIARGVGAEMTLIHVVERESSPVLSEDEANEMDKAEGRRILAASAEAARATDMEVRTELKIGHAPIQILRYASAYRPQLLFIGATGLGKVAEFLMGSVTKEVIKDAKTSVVVVR
ncbi:MAG: universal stress protein [Methanomassiliicoccus sp.]|nr:universal stress protein [Methanomassiliicoccus sp.]